MDDGTASNAAAYIASILSVDYDQRSIDVFLEEENFSSQLLVDDFNPLSGANTGYGAAIDGSSCTILDGHTFIVGGRRVGMVMADETSLTDVQVDEVVIDILSRHNYQEVFAEHYNEAMGSDPLHLPTSLEEARDALRTLAEHVRARSLINELSEGNMLMLDGSLEGSRLLGPVIRANCEQAAKRGIHLAGVCKHSDLYTGRLPVLSWITRIGSKACAKQRWYYPLSEDRHIYIARLHPAARFAFRIDINPLEKSPPSVLTKLTAFTDDVAYLGYPYPLAHAHRMAVIAAEESVMLREHLRGLVLQKGYTLEDWESVFFNYHHYLE